jgi:hypothetical protein
MHTSLLFALLEDISHPMTNDFCLTGYWYTVQLASCLISSRDIEGIVGVDVEGDLDLRNTTRCRSDVRGFEFVNDIV